VLELLRQWQLGREDKRIEPRFIDDNDSCLIGTIPNWEGALILLIYIQLNGFRRAAHITKMKINVLKTKIRKLLGESPTHLDEEFESF